jgi:hypothetical protein
MKNWLPLEFLPELHIATCAVHYAASFDSGLSNTDHSSLCKPLLQSSLFVFESAPPDALNIAMYERVTNGGIAMHERAAGLTSPPVPFSNMKSPPCIH